MPIGKLVQNHKLNGSGGEYPKAGTFRNCPVTQVADVTGKDKIQSLIVSFKVGKYTPGKNVKGERYAPDTHTEGEIVKFHAKFRPDIFDTVLNNVKNACLGFVRQLQADAGEDPNAIGEEDITEEIVDNAIFCNNSKIVDLVMDFNVTEEYTRSARPDGTRGTVTKFTWLVRLPDGTVTEVKSSEGAEGEDESESAEDESESAEDAPEPEPVKAPVVPAPVAAKGKAKKS